MSAYHNRGNTVSSYCCKVSLSQRDIATESLSSRRFVKVCDQEVFDVRLSSSVGVYLAARRAAESCHERWRMVSEPSADGRKIVVMEHQVELKKSGM